MADSKVCRKEEAAGDEARLVMTRFPVAATREVSQSLGYQDPANGGGPSPNAPLITPTGMGALWGYILPDGYIQCHIYRTYVLPILKVHAQLAPLLLAMLRFHACEDGKELRMQRGISSPSRLHVARRIPLLHR